ncbi:MAG: hypothetical protein E4H16_01170, partial [Candidatus Atribacteria bacterium]
MSLTGKHVFLLLILFCSLSFSSNAQTAKTGDDFKLIHSDKLFLNKVDNENILELNGKVHFFYGKTEFHSNKAIIFDTQKIARLIGNVSVKNDTLNAVADSIAYYRLTEVMNMGGSVIITEQKTDGVFHQMTADNGTYDK